MNVLLMALIIFVGGELTVVLYGELSGRPAVRGAAEGWPWMLLRLAVRRAPAGSRAELGEEWAAELHEILNGPAARPVLRLYRAVRYSLGLIRVAPRLTGRSAAGKGAGRGARALPAVRHTGPLLASDWPFLVACVFAGRFGYAAVALRMVLRLYRYVRDLRAGLR